MGITLVQSKVFKNVASAVSSFAATFNNPTTAGNSIFAIVLYQQHQGNVSSIGDGGDSFVDQTGDILGQENTQVFLANGISGTHQTVTVNFTAPTSGYLIILEYNVGGTGLVLASSLPTFYPNSLTIATGGGTTGTAGPAAFPYNPGLGLFIVQSQVDGGAFSSLASGWVQEATDTDTGNSTAYLVADQVFTSPAVSEPSVHIVAQFGSTYDFLLLNYQALPIPSGASPIVARQSNNVTFNGSSVTVPFKNNNLVGNSIIVMLLSGASPSGAPSDTRGNSPYTSIRGPDHNVTDGAFSQAWLAKNIAAGANSVTINFGASTFGAVIIAEYPPLTAVDKTAFGTGTGSALASGNTAATTSANELIIGWGGSLSQDSDGWVAGSGYVEEQVSQQFQFATSMAFEDKVVSSTGVQNAGQTATPTATPYTWSMSVVTLTFPAPPATVDKVHNVDAFVFPGGGSKVHNVDAFLINVPVTRDKVHNIDTVVQTPLQPNTHSVDCYILFQRVDHIRLAGNIIFPIRPPNFLRLVGTLATQTVSFVNLAGTIQFSTRAFVNLLGTITSANRSYVRLKGTIQNPTYDIHNIDAVVAVSTVNNNSFVNLNGTIIAPVQVGPCGSFPDSSYVNLRGWIVAAGDSVQMPNSGFTSADDFLSSQVALAAYKPMSVFILNGIALIVTAFTTGVISWQTRTRSWLRRVDAAPNGILLTSKVNKHTLPNGAVITTTTNVVQNQDMLTTTVTIQNSSTPERTSVIVTEKSKTGSINTIEKDTVNINGVATTTTKTVHSNPPTTENIQPLKVTTLDGVEHYQFFGQDNTEWAGGEAEGTTLSTSVESITGTTKVTKESVATPDGKIIETTTTVTGTQEAGTTTTATSEQFNGTQTVVHKVITYPNGSQTITDTVTDDTTGDSVETSTETVTDEFGQVTVTKTKTETQTFVDPTTGIARTIETKTVTVDKGGVITTDNSVDTTNDFEDDIYTQKVQVIFIQEFTLNVVIDEMSMFGLWEINETHQKNYALLELFGQQLGNLNLSFLLRQSLIDQYNAANACVIPVKLQANGRVYQVVFAPSASAFRAKYIPGTEPHVYELQMILQERSNLINGTNTSF